MMENLKNNIKKIWSSLSQKSAEDGMSGIGREKIIVFLIALILAFGIWFVVNLNRDYNIDVKVPLVLGNIKTEQALVEELPSEVTASISGDGWNLINVYKNPPPVYIDISEKEVNLFDQVRQQMSTVSNVAVQTVKPLYLQLKLEKKQSKKVPVVSNVSVSFAKQYSFLNDPKITPDSVTIRGGASKIANIFAWRTDSLQLDDVKKSVSTEVGLKESGSLVVLSPQQVKYQANVVQFTEGDLTVPVETRDFPAGNSITFSPSSIRIQYQIPLAEYATYEGQKLFTPYVTYSQIQQDTTGFITPKIDYLEEKAHLKVRKINPPKVAYFTIIGN